MTTRLKLVPKAKKAEPPDVSYESAQRRHVMSRDWGAVHVAADKRKPFERMRWVAL